MKLNPSQNQAVTHTQGPLLIVAGAGTGKTTVLVERIRHLITQQKVEPQHIFATTFTEKTAEEMLNRLDTVMPYGYQQPWIGTFHSLCDRLLRLEALEVGLDPRFTIMTRTDQWIFIKQHLFKFKLSYYLPLSNPTKFISALIAFFSRLQDEAVDPSAFATFAQTALTQAVDEAEKQEAERLKELSQAYRTYQELKYTESVLDFGDLINQTIRLFRERPNVLKRYQDQFKHILIDEFQDTNFAQFELITLLAPPETNPNLTVVGDDDQAIYRFRGASMTNILEFKSIYPQAKEVVLQDNYRSTQNILDAAYLSIQQNNPDRLESKLQLSKQLISQKQDLQKHNQTKPASPTLLAFDHVDDEVSWTTQEILRLHHEGVPFKDMAVLTRSNSQLDPYSMALRTATIPFQLVSNRGLFDQPEIKTLIAFCRLLVNPNDSLALFQLAQTDSFGLQVPQLLPLLQESKKANLSIWDYARQQGEEVLDQAWDMITSFQKKALTQTTSQVLADFITTSHYLRPWLEQENQQNTQRIKNVNLFFKKLKRFEATTTDLSVISFVDTLDAWLEAGEDPGQAQVEDIDTVSLMTVHAAKGLEFEAVFVGSLVAGRFPSSNRKETIPIPDKLIAVTSDSRKAHLQEERRLFYVAMTRAKQHLYATLAQNYGGKRTYKPSGFLLETGLPIQNLTPESLADQASLTPDKTHTQEMQSPPHTLQTVSYSQLDTFDVCPLKYKYRYILKIPTQPTHAVAFGQTMHTTLQHFHQLKLAGQQPTEKELIALYTQYFIDTGYLSAEHRQERFDSGAQALQEYHRIHESVLGTPVLLEQNFRLKVDSVTLIGKIDRIDQDDQGNYELIDYKTGSPKTQKSVDNNDQLTLYALAAQRALGITPTTLSLYFIEANKKISTQRSSQDFVEAEEKLAKQIDTIKTSNFPPKPNYPFPCGFCEYNQICPFAKRS